MAIKFYLSEGSINPDPLISIIHPQKKMHLSSIILMFYLHTILRINKKIQHFTE